MGSSRAGAQFRCKSLDLICADLLLMPVNCSEILLYTMAVGASVLVVGGLYLLVNMVEEYQKERIIRYEIAVPTPPADGKAIERPSIKVRVSEESPWCSF
jgi:hypothetical protein